MTTPVSTKANEMTVLKTHYFDYESTLERIGGDREVFVEIAKLFLEMAPGSLEAIRAAIEAEDARSVGLASHKLKGAVCNFGLGAPYERANLLEEMGKEKDLSRARETFNELDEALSAMIREMTEVLDGSPEVSASGAGL